MKFNYDAKNKKAEMDADVERLVEKSLEQHEKNWKEKFDTKHKAKKEILELKHKHKLEENDKNNAKKGFIEKIYEEKRKIKELELEERRRIEEEKKKNKKTKIIISVILGVVGCLIFIVGNILGSQSGDPDSGWYAMGIAGMFIAMSIAFIWIDFNNKKKK